MSQGTIVQCIGAVVDIQFPRDAMPKVYDALMVDPASESPMVEQALTFEVQQQLGDGVVRTIALGSSDGLRRGMPDHTHPAVVVRANRGTPVQKGGRASEIPGRFECGSRFGQT